MINFRQLFCQINISDKIVIYEQYYPAFALYAW
jgi:hypothetical protein